MNAADMNKPSATDWNRIDNMTDAEIDTSDIAPLDDSFFARATLRLPNERTPAFRNLPDREEGSALRAAESDVFFRALGLAVFEAQGLEYNLVSLYAATQLVTGKPQPSGKIRQLMDTRYQQALGQLVHDAAQDLGLDSGLEELLRQALQERNWLVHRFFRQYAPVDEHAEPGREAITKLRRVQALLAQTAEAIRGEGIRRLLTTGASQEQIQADMHAATEQYIAEELERV